MSSVHRQKRFILSLSLSLGIGYIFGEALMGPFQTRCSYMWPMAWGWPGLKSFPSSPQMFVFWPFGLTYALGAASMCSERVGCLVYWVHCWIFKINARLWAHSPVWPGQSFWADPLGWQVAAAMPGCKLFLGAGHSLAVDCNRNLWSSLRYQDVLLTIPLMMKPRLCAQHILGTLCLFFYPQSATLLDLLYRWSNWGWEEN